MAYMFLQFVLNPIMAVEGGYLTSLPPLVLNADPLQSPTRPIAQFSIIIGFLGRFVFKE